MTTHAVAQVPLLEALRRGCNQAYGELMARYGRSLHRAAWSILDDAAEAEDCVQDALLTALCKQQDFQGRAAFRSWLHRIVVNNALMRLRQRRRGIELCDDDQRIETHIDDNVDLEKALLEFDGRERLYRALETLPERHQQVLKLRDLQECNTEQTATLLGIRPGAVKTRLHRARMALRTALEALDQHQEVALS